MIKAFNQLNENEKSAVENYLNQEQNPHQSTSEIFKTFNSKIYNFGEGVLFNFQEDQILGSVKVILEAAIPLSAIYIHALSLSNIAENESTIAKELIDAAIELGESKTCQRILLGFRDEKIAQILKLLGYLPSYNAYKMKLENRQSTGQSLELIPLSHDNKEVYLHVFNQSFNDIPHGGYFEMDNVEKFLEDTSENQYYLVKEKNEIIGFLNLEIENKIGMFDMGLRKAFRGQGFGKRLLETAIHLLNQTSTTSTMLTVIEKNAAAYNLYQKRGFVIDDILSQWIEIRI